MANVKVFADKQMDRMDKPKTVCPKTIDEGQ